MKKWLSILKDEMSLFLSDKSILLTCLVAPILYAIFIGTIYLEKEVSKIPIAIVDLDHTNLSRKVSQLINTAEKVSIEGSYSSLDDAMFHFNNLEVQDIVILPKYFEKKTLNLDGSHVELILNNTKFLTSNEINKSVQKVILTVSGGVRMKYFISNNIPIEIAKQKAQPIVPVIKSIYNITNNYGDYLLPILLILILQQTLIIGFGQSMVHEFKHGALVYTAKFNFFEFCQFLSAKSFYYLILYVAYFFVFYKLIFPYFSINFDGSIYLHLVLSCIFIIIVILYSIILASFFKSPIGWTEVMAFSTYPFFLVSGYSWPIDAMPKVMQVIANLLPSTPYYRVFNTLAIEGGKLNNITNGFIHLLLLLLLGYLLLYVRFCFIKRSDKKQDLHK
jgi:ABC-2 type transport system permease protein